MNMIQQIVSLTSQGQISIPRSMLRHHKVMNVVKVSVTPTKTGWHVEPVVDFFSLEGALNRYAIKNKTINEIIELEERAAEEGWGDEG